MFDDHDFDSYELRRHVRERERKGKEPEWAKELLRHRAERPMNGDPLSQYLTAAVEYAGRALRQLEHEVYVRERLHDQAISQLDYQIAEAAHSLTKFIGWGVGYNRGVDQKRVELEHRLDTLRREKRTSRLRLWDDLVGLRSQLRDLRRQYEIAQRRARLANR